jgi:EPS-associated MarR family transcriptional regulator
MLTDEYRYKIFKLVEANPEISQRALAKELGISLGKVNFCLRALVEKGQLKMRNFRNSKQKLSYMYLLTPKGFEEKSSVTARFLKRKLDEYETLQREIEQLRVEVQTASSRD